MCSSIYVTGHLHIVRFIVVVFFFLKGDIAANLLQDEIAKEKQVSVPKPQRAEAVSLQAEGNTFPKTVPNQILCLRIITGRFIL